jgi:hypothetical protein
MDPIASKWGFVTNKNKCILVWKYKKLKDSPTRWHNMKCGNTIEELEEIVTKFNAIGGNFIFDVGQGGSWHIHSSRLDGKLVGWHGYNFKKEYQEVEIFV